MISIEYFLNVIDSNSLMRGSNFIGLLRVIISIVYIELYMKELTIFY